MIADSEPPHAFLSFESSGVESSLVANVKADHTANVTRSEEANESAIRTTPTGCRSRAASALRKRLAAPFDQLPQSCLVISSNGTVEFVNYHKLMTFDGVKNRSPRAARFADDIESYVDGKKEFLSRILLQSDFTPDQLAEIRAMNSKDKPAV